jgi:hypothetical protein
MKRNPWRRCLLGRPTVQYKRPNRRERQFRTEENRGENRTKAEELRCAKNSSWRLNSGVKTKRERRRTKVASCGRRDFWVIVTAIVNDLSNEVASSNPEPINFLSRYQDTWQYIPYTAIQAVVIFVQTPVLRRNAYTLDLIFITFDSLKAK